MLGPIVECVANVSEGRRPAIIQQLATAIQRTAGVSLLHTDAGQDANRTVFTFAGNGEAVLEAAFSLFKTACATIDMQAHQGNHPRMGVVDVCPFVPLQGADLAYCAKLAKRLGQSVWQELGVPVYLYEAAASAPHRQNLASVRKGEYEGLSEKMQQPEWQVDFGTDEWNPRTGTAIIGARPFLIAWNINLATQDVSIAKEIAANLRGSGRLITQQDGSKKRKLGLFSGLKAIGWKLEEYDICQVSTNVVAPDTTSLFEVYQKCSEMALELGTLVTGSELIGLIPEQYLHVADGPSERKQNLDLAVKMLGLADLAPFDWRERVLEEMLVHRTSASSGFTPTN